jgi:mono/diheme cytochrome c family protein
MKKVLGIAALSLVVLAVAGISFTVGWKPILGPEARALTDRRFESTAARLERGEYLVENVAQCLFCHSEYDPSAEGLPIKRETRGAGRSWESEGLPWLQVPNITADADTGAGSWSDDALARAIREGIGHDGRTLFPVMPYRNYRRMSDEDLASIVVYIRTVPAVRRASPPSEIPFPVNRFINLEPQRIDEPIPPPDVSTPAKRGEYLLTIASCGECHTPMTPEGQFLPGMFMAGGNMIVHEQRTPAAAANLTSSPSGIPYYTEGLFLEVMRTGRVRERKLSDNMPWFHYKGMTDEDLKAIFAYLQTLAPVEHYVSNLDPVALCARCNIEHGGGGRNKPAAR